MSKLQTFQENAKDWWAEARTNPLFVRALMGAGLIALVDQVSKFIIVHQVKLPEIGRIELSSIFDLTYVENKGASFGMLAGGMESRILLSTISIGIAVALIIWLGQIKKPLPATGVAFIVGGALGNLYDRIAYGFVVDFLDFSAVPFPNINRISEFPFIEVFIGGFVWIFNIADTAINIGVMLILLDAYLDSRKSKSV